MGNIQIIKKMSLKKFPFEIHRLDVTIHVNGLSTDSVVLTQWDLNSPVVNSLDIDVGDNIQWKLMESGFSSIQQNTVT